MVRFRRRNIAANVAIAVSILLVPVAIIVLIGRAVSAPNRDIYWCEISWFGAEFAFWGVYEAIAFRRRRG